MINLPRPITSLSHDWGGAAIIARWRGLPYTWVALRNRWMRVGNDQFWREIESGAFEYLIDWPFKPVLDEYYVLQ